MTRSRLHWRSIIRIVATAAPISTCIMAAAVLLGTGIAFTAGAFTPKMSDVELSHRITALCEQVKHSPSAPYVVDECGPVAASDVPEFLTVWCPGVPVAGSYMTPQHAASLETLVHDSGRCP